MRAKGDVARRFGNAQANAGFEPLTVFVDETDRDHRHGENLRGQTGHAVETGVVRGVENLKRGERVQPLCFMGWKWCHLHRYCPYHPRH